MYHADITHLCCSVLQCVAVCCSVLQCIAVHTQQRTLQHTLQHTLQTHTLQYTLQYTLQHALQHTLQHTLQHIPRRHYAHLLQCTCTRTPTRARTYTTHTHTHTHAADTNREKKGISQYHFRRHKSRKEIDRKKKSAADINREKKGISQYHLWNYVFYIMCFCPPPDPVILRRGISQYRGEVYI